MSKEEKQKLREGLADMAQKVESDHEVQMARSELYKAAKYAVSIHGMLRKVSEMEGIDGWVASKITKAADYMGTVAHYLEYEMGMHMEDPEMDSEEMEVVTGEMIPIDEDY